MAQNRPNRPIDYLRNSMNKVILIKVKRNRLFRGNLGGFDDNLNLYLEGTEDSYWYYIEYHHVTD